MSIILNTLKIIITLKVFSVTWKIGFCFKKIKKSPYYNSSPSSKQKDVDFLLNILV